MSPTLGLNEMQNMLQSEDPNRQLYKFGFGQSPCPVPQCMVEGLIESAHAKDYLPVQGLYRLRNLIASYYNEAILTTHCGDISADNIIITPGTKQSFFLLMLAMSQHCEILLPSPSWVSYAPQATILGRTVTWIESNCESSWKVLPSTLEKHGPRRCSGPLPV